MKFVLLAIAGLTLTACTLVFVGVSSSASPVPAPVQPSTTTQGVASPDGTSVTWTVTVSGGTGNTAEIVFLFPPHPPGTALVGLPLFIKDNGGSASFTQTGTKCGEDVSVDLLMGDVTLSDVPGEATVPACPTPTTTTTTTTLPPQGKPIPPIAVPTTTTTTLPPQGNPITPVPIPCVTSGFAGCSGGGENCGAGPTGHCDPTPTTLPDISQEQQQVQVAPGVTGGNG